MASLAMAGDQWRLQPYVFRDVLFDNLDQWVNSTHCGGCHRPLCAGFQALHFTSPGRGDVLRLAIGAVLHQTRGCARCHCLGHQSRKLCCRQHQPVPEPGFDIAPGKHRPLRLHHHQNMRRVLLQIQRVGLCHLRAPVRSRAVSPWLRA